MAIVKCELITCTHNSCAKPIGECQCPEPIELKWIEAEYQGEEKELVDCINYVRDVAGSFEKQRRQEG